MRVPADLEGLDGLVLPGRRVDDRGPPARLARACASRWWPRLDQGLPAFGTCAGLIVLAREMEDGRPDQRPLGLIDLTARRNGYGRQVRSFEAPVALAGEDEPMPGVFIRAPRITRAGDGRRGARDAGR